MFRWLQRTGNVPDDDMLRTFNMGIGLIVVAPRQVRPYSIARRAGETQAPCIGAFSAAAARASLAT